MDFMALKQTENVTIREAAYKDLSLLRDLASAMKQVKDPDYFENQFAHQKQDARLILLIGCEGREAGYGILNWQPKYAFFRKMNIPEIQDLNVLPEFRRRGLATGFIEYCEEAAQARGHEHMGISVALHAGAGPAQRLYAGLGYIPDGNGVTYDRHAVAAGEFKPVDEQLCLMMVKGLDN